MFNRLAVAKPHTVSDGPEDQYPKHVAPPNSAWPSPTRHDHYVRSTNWIPTHGRPERRNAVEALAEMHAEMQGGILSHVHHAPTRSFVHFEGPKADVNSAIRGVHDGVDARDFKDPYT